MQHILELASDFIINIISDLSYLGIYLGMVIESASIPLPSEVIMGFAGYLVYKGEMNIWLAALAGAVGNISGSTIMYFIGLKGGRPFLEKHKKFFHISDKKLELADKWFAKWGDELVFAAQLMPGVRTFISFPAGMLKVNFKKFIIYTFIGAFIWCLILAYIASSLGSKWEEISKYMKEFQYVIIALIIAVFAFIVYKVYRSKRKA